MITILIKGKAATDFDGDFTKLDGIDCQDCFSDYFSDELEKISASKGLAGGYTEFKCMDSELWTHTKYTSNKILTDDEIKLLAEYTQGQWSDGVGEGFEQEPCAEIDNKEVYISMWCPGQTLMIEQTNY